MHIGIVGAGIAGLTIGNLLKKMGYTISIYDQAKALEPVGAGFTLQPNGLKIMERIGVYDQILQKGAKINKSIIYNKDGFPFSNDIMKSLSGSAESYSIHRGDFQKILIDNILDDAVTIKLNHEVVSVENKGDIANITFKNNKTYTHDLLIGSDGIRSRIRNFVDPRAQLEREGISAIRALIPKYNKTSGDCNFRAWFGSNKVFITYPVKNSKKINIAAYVPSNDPDNICWSKSISKQNLFKEFEDWSPEVLNLIEHVETAFSWELYDHKPLSAWSKGPVCVIGDAAHAMLPYLGQGANQAIEDCGILASILESKSKTGILNALKKFEAIRKDSVSSVQMLSRQAGEVFRNDFNDNVELKTKKINEILSKR